MQYLSNFSFRVVTLKTLTCFPNLDKASLVDLKKHLTVSGKALQKSLAEQGFEPIRPRRSCYFHLRLQLFLIVYVGDFKLAGPSANLKNGWHLIGQGLSVEDPQAIDAKGATYLGCRQRRTSITLPSGRVATAMTYDMEEFLDTCVQKYVELAGPGTTVKHCTTPFLQEDHRRSPAGTPARHSGPARHELLHPALA